MSRLCLVGDMHWRTELPYSSSIDDGRKSEWNDVLNEIVRVAESCDAIVLMGDVFNSKHNHSSVIRRAVEFLNRLGSKDVYIISGNHCRYGTETALDFLKKINHKNWHVYTEVTEGVQIGDVKATFIPFVTPSLLGVETKEEAEGIILKDLKPSDLAFCHHAVKGAKTTEFFEGEIVLDKNKMESLFGLTVYGHIHKAEKLSDKILGTGSIFPQEVGEPGKSIWVWDSQAKEIEEVPLPVRGIFKLIWEEPRTVIPPHSIVKCYVTNRSTDIGEVRTYLKGFEASALIEQYPNERAKEHLDDGSLDLSMGSMLKRYSEAKGLSYVDIVEGFNLI